MATRSRRLAAAGLSLAVVVAACSSGSPLNPGATGSTGGGSNNGGTSLMAGLDSNLDELTSYRFSWSSSGTSAGADATAVSTGSFAITGTVINSPTESIAVDYLGVHYIQIGDKQWSSFDGSAWYEQASSSSGVDLSIYLPTTDYATWFDSNSTQFSAAGEETRNGVRCVHFKGSDSLGKLYGASAGVSAGFQADLWVASDGNYPVSGVYGFSTGSAAAVSSFRYQFDITNVNDSSTRIDPPANAVPMPS
jgi:hypothetical protein